MKHSGLVVLAFIIYHLAHFTAGAVAGAGEFKAAASYTMSGEFRLLGFPVVAKGQAVQDVYSMVFLGFRQPAVALFYIVAVALLSLHLLHGVDAMTQTLGLRNHKWAAGLRRCVALFSLAYLLGNVAIPGAILTGMLSPAAGTVAAQRIAASPAPQR
jgi:succinate dehydrogenase / fumarate reductase cytochrome b subunit